MEGIVVAVFTNDVVIKLLEGERKDTTVKFPKNQCTVIVAKTEGEQMAAAMYGGSALSDL